MKNAAEKFELVYSTGGHGGPYNGLDEAKKRAEALLRGGRDNWIAVVPAAKVTDLSKAGVVDVLYRNKGWTRLDMKSLVRRSASTLLRLAKDLAETARTAGRDLGWWQEGEKKWYLMPKGGWGNEDIYFFPQKKQKNGGVSGLMKHDDGRGHAKKNSIDKMSLRQWKEVPESDVPTKVKSRIQERMASITELTADLREATDKTAQSMGKQIFQSLVDIKKMYAARKAADEQTAQLLREIMIKLSEELEPRNRGVERAINRLNNAISRPTTPDNLRNQVFKVADELGMRLPSGMF